MINTVIAIYPGRFQPFGLHHAKAFQWLQQQFGSKNTYVVTSDKIELPKSPFSFKEKKQIINKYGIKNVIKSTSPYKSYELLEKYDPKTTAVVFMVGEKDMIDDPRFKIISTPTKKSFFQEYEKNKNKLQGYDKHGYLIVAPHISIPTKNKQELSGTAIRNTFSNIKSNAELQTAMKNVFGWYDSEIGKIIVSKLSKKTEEIMPESLFSKGWWGKLLDLNEGYPTQDLEDKHKEKVEKLKKFLHQNIGREFVYDFDEYPKTTFGVKMESVDLLKEGGTGGHMQHVFDIDWVKNGNDLIKAFQMSIDYLKKGPASVKIDGVNASIRLIKLNGARQFVLDRGSNKPLDVKGITKADLEDRFAPGHGMIKVGETVLDIFNSAISSIMPELKLLGLWDNPNILFNIEYVSGTTNVLQYGRNFLAIHGLMEIKQVTTGRRSASEIPYSESALQKLIDKLSQFAKKYDFEILGSVPTTLKGNPDLNFELNKPYTINYGDREETKTLKQWLSKAKLPDKTFKTTDGKVVSALSKDVLINLSKNIPISQYVADQKDFQSVIDGYFIYLATMKLGDAILDKLDSPLGPVSEHEGIVIRDPEINNVPYKITGKFILGGLTTSFRK